MFGVISPGLPPKVPVKGRSETSAQGHGALSWGSIQSALQPPKGGILLQSRKLRLGRMVPCPGPHGSEVLKLGFETGCAYVPLIIWLLGPQNTFSQQNNAVSSGLVAIMA